MSTVSKGSLRFHNLLHKGIETNTVRDALTNGNFRFNFHLARDKGKFFIKNDKTLYPVRDINAFIRVINADNIDRVLEILSNRKTVEIPLDGIGQLLEGGRDRYESAIRKSLELLADTEKQFGIEKTREEFGGKTIEGYFVQGQLRRYFVCVEDLKVFNADSGQYICIVDKGDISQNVGADKLINRIYALANDSVIAQHVHTI